MKLSPAVKAIRDAYARRFPVPRGLPGDQIDQACRDWSTRLAAQVEFSTGDPRWGMKRAGVGRPLSKDTIAFADGLTLVIWDLISGASTGKGSLVDDPDSQDVTGQIFVVIPAVDSIGAIGAPAPVPPPPPPPVVDDPQLETLIKLLEQAIDAASVLEGRLQQVSDRLDAVIASGVRIHL